MRVMKQKNAMKATFVTSCMVGTLLVLFLAVPVGATPGIAGVSPSYGYNGASVTGVVITGTDFNVSSNPGTVRLVMDGESNITAAITDNSDTSITCTFPISGAEPGAWDVVVVNRDQSDDVLSGGFTIYDAITLTSVSPETAWAGNDSVELTVEGSGLSDIQAMYLYNVDYDNITADIDTTESTGVVGTFDLTDAEPDYYDICVEDSLGAITCGLDFEILNEDVGSIDIASSPSGANIYLDSEYVGTTPYTIEGVDSGSHEIEVSKTGYTDYSRWVTVSAGSTLIITADLNEVTTVTTSVTTVATTSTVQKTSTAVVPTPWPATTTQESPLEGAVVLGAIAIGFMVLPRK